MCILLGIEAPGWPITEVCQRWHILYVDNELLSVFLKGNLAILHFLSEVGVTVFENKIFVTANNY